MSAYILLLCPATSWRASGLVFLWRCVNIMLRLCRCRWGRRWWNIGFAFPAVSTCRISSGFCTDRGDMLSAGSMARNQMVGVYPWYCCLSSHCLPATGSRCLDHWSSHCEIVMSSLRSPGPADADFLRDLSDSPRKGHLASNYQFQLSRGDIFQDPTLFGQLCPQTLHSDLPGPDFVLCESEKVAKIRWSQWGSLFACRCMIKQAWTLRLTEESVDAAKRPWPLSVAGW